MIRFATIGTNFVVEWFLQCAQKVEDLVYNGTYSRSFELGREFAQKYNGNLVFDDLNELARSEEIDAVYIASPNSLHYEQAKLMIEHRKHVLIEKTITSNKKELENLIKLAKDNDVVIMEAMRPVHDPGFFAIKRAIEKVAPVRRATFQYCQYSSRYDKFKNGIVENAFNPKFSNGSLMDIGVYCVHPMVKLFGMPEDIQATATILPNSIDGQGTIVCKYNDMMAEALYSKITNSRLPSQIQGEKGAVIIEEIPNPRKITIIYNDGTKEKMDVPDCELNMIYEAEEWTRLIKLGKFTDEHIQYSLTSLEIMDEARRQQGIKFPADKVVEAKEDCVNVE